MKTIVSLFFLLSTALNIKAQHISGRVMAEGIPISGALVTLNNGQYSGITDSVGRFYIDRIKSGSYKFRISFIGFMAYEQKINLLDNASIFLGDIILRTDALGLNETVITGSRSAIKRKETPVIVNVISNKLLGQVQAVNLAEGLNYTPGLRVETNCQNCGFSDVRLNGLQGPYSQILINSRPIFGALSAVYGLEQIPTTMIEKVEVVRGGGSVLYGGNAIAGTINIITREPNENTYELQSNTSLTGFKTIDQTVSGAISNVNKVGNAGYTIFASQRNRKQYDANDDGFSEITKLRNTSVGTTGFIRFADGLKLSLSGQYLQEFRRGGNKLNIPPHQTDITEQIATQLAGTNATLEWGEAEDLLRGSVYASYQYTIRDSYYGGGGRILGPKDTLTQQDRLAINAYGNSLDNSYVSGTQLNIGKKSSKLKLVLGVEAKGNKVNDEMPGYNRSISQLVSTLGGFAQVEYQPISKLSITAGGRYDGVMVNGKFDYGDTIINTGKKYYGVWVPRLTLLWKATSDLKIRSSYAQGYRAPQAFSEDLHVETIGGAARFTNFADGLLVERSHSFNTSIDYFFLLRDWQINAIVDGFYTRLNNPFINADAQQLANGVSIVTVRNGKGAFVRGFNLELNATPSARISIQSGFTIQEAIYEVPELIWKGVNEGKASALYTNNILRTPKNYGFISANYKWNTAWSTTVSAVYTGSMSIPHVINPSNEFLEIVTTQSFLDITMKITRKWDLGNERSIEAFIGCYNLLNSYQQDFDKGSLRDANYIYGPNRPASLFFGFKLMKI